MKKNLIVAMVLVAVSLTIAGNASAQDWRGTGRLQGVVTDPAGKPIAGAKVILTATRGSGGGPEAIKTDAKGRWAAGGLGVGVWNIDVEADGFEKRRGSAELADRQNVPPLKTVLDPVPQKVEAPAEQTHESISVGGVEITPETAAALEAANNFMKAEKWAEAAAEYEKALVQLSDNQSLKFALSRAYYGAGELKKAIAPLNEVYTADTGNITAATLLANMLAEDGQLDQAKKILDAMPPGSLTDPTAIVNIGILFMNKNQAQDAWTYFDKAAKIAPEAPETYYYRALAELQLRKNDAAKADLQKVIALAPDGEEAKDAKELLEQMQ